MSPFLIGYETSPRTAGTLATNAGMFCFAVKGSG
jgi:hypothetical protein